MHTPATEHCFYYICGMNTDSFTFKQLTATILIIVAVVLIFGFSVKSCMFNREVKVTQCTGEGMDNRLCSTITINFDNMPLHPESTAAVSERIIQQISK